MEISDEIILFLYTTFQANPDNFVPYTQIYSHISDAQIQVPERAFFGALQSLIENGYVANVKDLYRITASGCKHAQTLFSDDKQRKKLFSSYSSFVIILGIIATLTDLFAFIDYNKLISKTGPNNVWWSAIIAIIGGVLVNLVSSVLFDIIKNELFLNMLKIFRRDVRINVEKWSANVNSRILKIAYIGEYVVRMVFPFVNHLLSIIWFWLVIFPSKSLWNKIIAPKWYKQGGVIDPGLIEVSLAVTAIIIALPAFSTVNIFFIGWARVISVALSIYVSLSFIDLYAKDRGSISSTVLLSPISDGPFFLLGWVIIIGALLAIIAFLFSGKIIPA